MLRESCRGVCAKRLTNGSGAWHKRRYNAFTILELLVVITIIIVLAGLILSTVGYVQKKGARSRAEAEIAAISAALESYKADNGIYPTSANTNALNARTNVNPSGYQTACFDLYTALTGDTDGNRILNSSDANPSAKSYFSFKPNMLSPPGGSGTVTGIRDPFGNSYGYSTAQQADSTKGFNPTFDLWSTANSSNQIEWIKNW
jgi:type II secretory pathway pseudopilin PulG